MSERLAYHPVVTLFPPWTEKEKADLYRDFDQFGIRVPVVTWRGVLGDGRGRYEYAQERGIVCPAVAVDHLSEEEMIHHAVSLNAKRRHLNPSQLAVIAVGMLPLLEEAGNRRKLDNLKNGRNPRVSPKVQICTFGEELAKSTEKVAKEMGVSRRLVCDAKMVQEQASPKVVQAMRNGQVRVTDAAVVAKADPAKQELAVEMLQDGRAKTLKQAFRMIRVNTPPSGEEKQWVKCPHCQGKGRVLKGGA